MAERIAATPDAHHVHRLLNGRGDPAGRPAADNDPAGSGPADVCGRFADVASRCPDRVALVEDGRTTTYAELARWSGAIASGLVAGGAGPGEIVAVESARSSATVAAFLGILRAGCGYLPVDTAAPEQRNRNLLDDAGCRWFLLREPGGRSVYGGRVTVPIPDGPPETTTDTTADGARAVAVDPSSVAYVNFTSGSTGRPKGVPATHRAVVNLVRFPAYVTLDDGPTVLHMAPTAFDAATFEIWGPLLNGGTCVVHTDAFLRFSRLRGLVRAHGVDVVFLTTALFNSIVDESPETLEGVRTILTGGEAQSPRHLRRAVERYGPGTVVHVYGPTEATTFSTYHVLDRVPDGVGPVPIGKPVQGATAFVVDGDRLCAEGEIGELCVAGPGLSPGYLGGHRGGFGAIAVDGPDGTDGTGDPDGTGGAALPVYRTGDLCRLDAAGDLYFEGRRDAQVKVRGHRIEPGEIVAALERHDDVVRGFVVADRDDDAGETRLRAFVVTTGTGTAGPDDLREHVRALLPATMVPESVHVCAALPLTPTGKVDRRRLLALAADFPAAVDGPGRAAAREGARR